MLDWLSNVVGQIAHLIGLCLLIYGLLSGVQALERGGMTGLLKAALIVFVAAILVKI